MEFLRVHKAATHYPLGATYCLGVSLEPTEGFIFFPNLSLQYSLSFEEFFQETQDSPPGQGFQVSS